MYAFDAGKRAIEAHLKRQGVEGTVSHTKDLGFYQVEYPVQGNPLVSILIPNKDQKDTLKQCLDSVFSKTAYANYEVIIIENNSQEKETWEYYEELKQRDNVKIVTWESGFNYSAINNFGEKSASGLDGRTAGKLPAKRSGDRGSKIVLPGRYDPACGNDHRNRRDRRSCLFKYAAFAKRLPAQGIFADGFECGDSGMYDDETVCI